MHISKNIVVSITLMGLIGMSCGQSRKSAYLADQNNNTQDAKTSAGDSQGATTATADSEALMAQAEEAWAARDDQAKLEQAIALYEKILANDPTQRAILVRLSRAHYFLANGHLKEHEAIIAAYDKGARYGEQAMGLNAAFAKAVKDGVKDEEALKLLNKEDAGGLYWAYSNLGKWAVAKGFTTVLKYKNKLKRFIDRVIELDPNYFYGAGDRGIGAFYAKAPSFAGGDLGLAKKHFAKSLEIAPDYFGTKVLIAEYWATKSQNKSAFKKALSEVLAADPTVLPEIIPEQKAEQRNAQRLLDQIDDLFE